MEYLYVVFGPPMFTNHLGELISLSMTGTVKEYQGRFLALLCVQVAVGPRVQVVPRPMDGWAASRVGRAPRECVEGPSRGALQESSPRGF